MNMMNEASLLASVRHLAPEHHIMLPPHLLAAAADREISCYCSRRCARFGLNALPLPDECMDFSGFTNRQPIWPPGYVGSFSHSNAIFVAAVARAHTYCSVSVDREAFIPLDNPENYLDLRCLEKEIACIEARFQMLNSTTAIIIFSLKAAVYKALYPFVGRCTLRDIIPGNAFIAVPPVLLRWGALLL